MSQYNEDVGWKQFFFFQYNVFFSTKNVQLPVRACALSYFRGTGEQMSNFKGNRGTKTIMGNRDHKKTNFRFLGNRGTSQFITAEQGNRSTPVESLTSAQLAIYMGPIWVPCGHPYGTHMGSATGFHMGPCK